MFGDFEVDSFSVQGVNNKGEVVIEFQGEYPAPAGGIPQKATKTIEINPEEAEGLLSDLQACVEGKDTLENPTTIWVP